MTLRVRAHVLLGFVLLLPGPAVAGGKAVDVGVGGGGPLKTLAPPSDDEFETVEASPKPDALASTLATYAASARAKGLRPFVEFWAPWCGPCMAIRGSMSDARMKKAFAGTFVVQLNADEWRGRLQGTGFSVDAIPVFYALDAAGRPTGRSIDGGAWGDNTPANMAPPLDAFFHKN